MTFDYIAEEQKLKGIYKIRYPSFGDRKRGGKKLFEDAENSPFRKLDFRVDESMLFYSGKGMLRGMHYQSALCKRQDRLIYVISGKLYIVVVSLREEEEDYGQWIGISIAEDEKTSLYVPGSCAIGTLALEESTFLLFYSGVYENGYDLGFRFDDEDLMIDWSMEREDLIVADQDLALPAFKTIK